uniref:Uncharacterized protein n=1 Tax=Glossina palpalis gambiensis TaxID=67801 RepID=A0A1B0AUX1_9MUSC
MKAENSGMKSTSGVVWDRRGPSFNILEPITDVLISPDTRRIILTFGSSMMNVRETISTDFKNEIFGKRERNFGLAVAEKVVPVDKGECLTIPFKTLDTSLDSQSVAKRFDDQCLPHPQQNLWCREWRPHRREIG